MNKETMKIQENAYVSPETKEFEVHYGAMICSNTETPGEDPDPIDL